MAFEFGFYLQKIGIKSMEFVNESESSDCDDDGEILVQYFTVDYRSLKGRNPKPGHWRTILAFLD